MRWIEFKGIQIVHTIQAYTYVYLVTLAYTSIFTLHSWYILLHIATLLHIAWISWGWIILVTFINIIFLNASIVNKWTEWSLGHCILYPGASIVVSPKFILLIWASLNESHSDLESATVYMIQAWRMMMVQHTTVVKWLMYKQTQLIIPYNCFVMWKYLASCILGPKRTRPNSNVRSNERTFECGLRNSNY